jgi:hypothetical protein
MEMGQMDLACKIFLYIFSIYHMITGIVSMFFPDFAMSFYKILYGYDPIERKHVSLIFKPWGALAAFAGLTGLFAAGNPERYRGVVLSLIILLILRIYYRLRFEHELFSIGGIPPYRNRINLAVLFVGVVILSGWLCQKMPPFNLASEINRLEGR